MKLWASDCFLEPVSSHREGAQIIRASKIPHAEQQLSAWTPTLLHACDHYDNDLKKPGLSLTHEPLGSGLAKPPALPPAPRPTTSWPWCCLGPCWRKLWLARGPVSSETLTAGTKLSEESGPDAEGSPQAHQRQMLRPCGFEICQREYWYQRQTKWTEAVGFPWVVQSKRGKVNNRNMIITVVILTAVT